jgi:hypothetical protein
MAAAKKSSRSKTKKVDRARSDEALKGAMNVAQSCDDWLKFFNAVFGKKGVLEQAFPDSDERAAFSNTNDYKKVMAILRYFQTGEGDPPFPTRRRYYSEGRIVITLPKAVYKSLSQEASDAGVNLNQFCVAKLSGK